MFGKLTKRFGTKATKFRLSVQVVSVKIPDKTRPKSLGKGTKVIIELLRGKHVDKSIPHDLDEENWGDAAIQVSIS